MEWKRIIGQPKMLLIIVALLLMGMLEYELDDMQSGYVEEVSGMVQQSQQNRYTAQEWKNQLNKQLEIEQMTAFSTQEEYEAAYVQEKAAWICLQWADHVINYRNEQEAVVFRTEQLQKKKVSSGQMKKYHVIKDDYLRLSKVDVSVGNDYAVLKVLENQVMQYILLLISLILVFHFFDERKRGLWQYIHTTVRGRCILAAERVGILTGSVTMLTLLAYGGLFFLTWRHTGIPEFSRMIQSVTGFGQFSHIWTVEQWILYFFGVKVIINVTMAMLAYGFISLAKSRSMGLFVFVGMIGIEALLYRLIPENGFFYSFKILNSFRLFGTADWCLEYDTLLLMGTVVYMRTIILALVVIICIGVIMGTILMNGRKKPSIHTGILARIVEHPVVGHWIAALPPAFTEIRKSFLWNGGLIVVVLVFVVIGKSTEWADVPYRSTDSRLKQIYRECNGELNEAKEYLDLINQELDENKEMGNLDRELQEEYLELSQEISYVSKMHEKGYQDVRVMDTRPYQSFFGTAMQKRKTTYDLLLILTLILVFSGVHAYERQHGMDIVIRTTAWGRIRARRDKLLLVGGTVTLLYGIAAGIFLWMHWYDYGFPAWNQTIKNIPMFENAGWNLQIGQVILINVVVGFLGMLVVVYVIHVLSSRFTVERTILIGVAVLVFPGMMSILGFHMFDWIAITRYMNIVNWIR